MKILITKWPFIRSEPSTCWEHLSIAHRTRKGWQPHAVFGQSYTSWSHHSSERDGVRGFHHLGLIFPFSQGHSYSALCPSITELKSSQNAYCWWRHKSSRIPFLLPSVICSVPVPHQWRCVNHQTCLLHQPFPTRSHCDPRCPSLCTFSAWKLSS